MKSIIVDQDELTDEAYYEEGGAESNTINTSSPTSAFLTMEEKQLIAKLEHSEAFRSMVAKLVKQQVAEPDPLKHLTACDVGLVPRVYSLSWPSSYLVYLHLYVLSIALISLRALHLLSVIVLSDAYAASLFLWRRSALCRSVVFCYAASLFSFFPPSHPLTHSSKDPRSGLQLSSLSINVPPTGQHSLRRCFCVSSCRHYKLRCRYELRSLCRY